MKKITTLILVMLTLMALPALAVNGNTSSQNIGQSASEIVQGVSGSGSTISQNTMQNANQAQASRGNISRGTTIQNIGQSSNQAVVGSNLNNATITQGTSQNANQRILGSRNNTMMNQGITANASQMVQGSRFNNTMINRSMGQNAGRNVSLNISLSFENITNKNLTKPMTAQERAIIGARTGEFFTNFPITGQFMVSQTDLNRFISENRNLQVVVIDQAAMNRQGNIPGAMFIPLANLANQINQLPTDRPIIIVGSNNIDTAAAVTALRMNGINAWMAENPRCVCD